MIVTTGRCGRGGGGGDPLRQGRPNARGIWTTLIVAQASAVAEEQEQKRLLKLGDGMLAGIRAGMLLGCFWDVHGNTI